MHRLGKTAYIFYHNCVDFDVVDSVMFINVKDGLIHIETYDGNQRWFPVNDNLKHIELIEPQKDE